MRIIINNLSILFSIIFLFSCNTDDDDTLENQSKLALITDFKVAHNNVFINAYIDDKSSTILLEVPNDLSINSISPKISTSINASVHPKSGESINLNNSAIYTVTAENGDKKEYKINMYTKNLLINPRGENNGANWEFTNKTNAGIEKNSKGENIFYIIQQDDGRNETISQNISLSRDYSNKYILFIGDMTTEKVVNKSITRHPYFWGLQKGDFSSDIEPIDQVIQSGMMHDEEANVWQVVSGTHLLLPNVNEIYFQIGQASMVGDPNDGTKSMCKDIEVRIFQSKQDAEIYVSKLYRS
ncbi:hypothetical protein [Aquimarina longa]|uniref:hypothetical protein n=1 Tax=Aquimarina longa TaxID=1080221 RepID=UPI000785C82B|nr:hypothetical protein [Aquimarina longa]